METETVLDSVVFQLTPTRTRCHLLIVANGRMEKLASGLVNPFLVQLKTAQDQIAEGRYSIFLMPNSAKDKTWFAKSTLERFVQFVSTPEVLEQVNTIGAEILQIGEAITIQSSYNLEISPLEDHPTKCSDSIEGDKHVVDAYTEREIILYEPQAHPSESNISKVQLHRVLESRKSALQKEQGMAFARAAAAGFDLDHMKHLVLFAECFGASRLMEACLRFMELWKQKHETGQWVEIEADKVMMAPCDFSSLNISGIVNSGEQERQRESMDGYPESHGELCTKNNGKTSANEGFAHPQHSYLCHDGGLIFPVLSEHHSGEFFQGQHLAAPYAQWVMHPSPIGHFFRHYIVQGMHFNSSCPGGNPFFQTPHAPLKDQRHESSRKNEHKKHTFCGKNSCSTSKNGIEKSSGSEDDDVKKYRSKVGRSRRKNTNNPSKLPANSKKHNASRTISEVHSQSEPESEQGVEEVHQIRNKNEHNNSKNEDCRYLEPKSDNKHQQAFPDSSMQDAKESSFYVGRDILSSEKEVYYKMKHTRISDPILEGNHERSGIPEQSTCVVEFTNDSLVPLYRKRSLIDELIISEEDSHAIDNPVVLHCLESSGKGFRGVPEDLVISKARDQVADRKYISYPLFENSCEYRNNMDSHRKTCESFVIPQRSNSPDLITLDRGNIAEQESELSTTPENINALSGKFVTSQLSCEPIDLSLMPDCGTGSNFSGYDPAIVCELEVQVKNTAFKGIEVVDGGVTNLLKRVDMRKVEARTIKGKPSNLSTSTDAQIQAKRSRASTADLQKIKKQKEQEEIKRLEALKRERQKRIAARSSSAAGPSINPPLRRKQNHPTKFSPGSNMGSKFSGTEPSSASTLSMSGSKFSGTEPSSVSPLPKSHIKTSSLTSRETQKNSIGGKANYTRIPGGLSQSICSLPYLKEETSDDFPDATKSSMGFRRLSDPKGSRIHQVNPQKLLRNHPTAKPCSSNENEANNNSANVRHDKVKTASQPELKLKMEPSRTADKKEENEASKKENNNVFHMGKLTKLMTDDENGLLLFIANADDNTIVDKELVLHEKEKAPVQDVEASYKGSDSVDTKGESVDISDNTVTHAPALPITIDEGFQGHFRIGFPQQASLNELNNDQCMDNELDCTSSSMVKEKPYPAPFARLSSLEVPCTRNSEYGKAQVISSEYDQLETSNARTGDSTDIISPQSNSDGLEKHWNKDFTKGFMRLLKFGRKNHNSGGSDVDKHDNTSGRNPALTYSHEVATLKNLISQEESPVADIAHKVSRPFLLLSPFRSKNSKTS